MLSYLEQLLTNTPFWVATFAWVLAQGIKIIITVFTEKKFEFSMVYAAGGMPSSHSALVTALAISIGKYYGFNTPVFAISAGLGMIVMYDAAGVRRAAGKQAAAINILFSHNDMRLEEQLKEILGHTPMQVIAGAVLGMLIGFVL